MEKKITLDEKLMDECLRAGEINEDNLMTILRDNKDTEFGKKYGFETINSVLDYKKNIPLSDYSMVDGYVKKMMRGERNVLTVYPERQSLFPLRMNSFSDTPTGLKITRQG